MSGFRDIGFRLSALRRWLTRYRLARGYCRYCENTRNQDPELCDLHLALASRSSAHTPDTASTDEEER